MMPLTPTQSDQLLQLCQQHRVRRLQLFGSAARDDFDPAHSDLDFLVEFEPMPHREHSDAFFGLYGDLARLFARRVDLLEAQAIANPYLRAAIEKSKKDLYAVA